MYRNFLICHALSSCHLFHNIYLYCFNAVVKIHRFDRKRISIQFTSAALIFFFPSQLNEELKDALTVISKKCTELDSLT